MCPCYPTHHPWQKAVDGPEIKRDQLVRDHFKVWRAIQKPKSSYTLMFRFGHNVGSCTNEQYIDAKIEAWRSSLLLSIESFALWSRRHYKSKTLYHSKYIWESVKLVYQLPSTVIFWLRHSARMYHVRLGTALSSETQNLYFYHITVSWCLYTSWSTTTLQQKWIPGR